MVAVDPSSKFAYVTGGTVVFGFTIDKTGTLKGLSNSPFDAGLNTLWVTVDPSGKFAYAVNHGSFGGGGIQGGVSAYSLNSVTGTLTAITGLHLPAGPSSITVIAVP